MKNKDKFSVLVSNPLDCEYIQKLAFKAGYEWGAGKGAQIFRTEQQQLAFYEKIKEIFYHSEGRYLCPEDNDSKYHAIYSFPKDAEKIHEIFTTPEPVEYKVGDYVVLVDELSGACVGEEKFNGSTQEIGHIDENNQITFKHLPHWHFNLKDIQRHATKEEIKKYKEGDDIYIGEHKVERLDGGSVKIGCLHFGVNLLKALKGVFACARDNNYTFVINKSGLYFSNKQEVPSPPTIIGDRFYKVDAENWNKIIKKAGIE